MSRWRSPILGRRYPLRTVCEVWRVPRSSVYALAAPATSDTPPAKRVPKTAESDPEVVAAIRAVLATSPFHTRHLTCGRSVVGAQHAGGEHRSRR
jgi:hypothetical protein